jgi:hypothetical protein
MLAAPAEFVSGAKELFNMEINRAARRILKLAAGSSKLWYVQGVG